MLKYDLLVYMGLVGVLVVTVVAALVLVKVPEQVDIETRKIRFAAATFTGILMLFIFSAVLYFVDAAGPGKEIFEKTITSMSPLAGAIIGYFFSSSGKASTASGNRE